MNLSLAEEEYLLYKTRQGVSTSSRKRLSEVHNSVFDFSDEMLVALAQKGEDWPVEELVRRYQSKTYAIAYSMCSGDPEEARDLTQEAFLRAFRRLERFRGDSQFYTWFYRIVVNACLDGRRRQRRRDKVASIWSSDQDGPEDTDEITQWAPDHTQGNNPLEMLSGKQLALEVTRALASLPEKQKIALQFKVIQGMTIREISEIMGVAEGTIKSHIFRATRFLQQTLKDWVQ